MDCIFFGSFLDHGEEELSSGDSCASAGQRVSKHSDAVEELDDVVVLSQF